jgi:hypothetical protein
LAVNVAASGYTLTASALGLTSATSSAFDVVAAPGTLGITGATPATVGNGKRLDPVTVQLRDASGKSVADAGRLITVSIIAGPTATLSGTLTQTTNAAGNAVFNDLAVTGAKGAFVLQFSTPGFAPTTMSFALHGGP